VSPDFDWLSSAYASPFGWCPSTKHPESVFDWFERTRPLEAFFPHRAFADFHVAPADTVCRTDAAVEEQVGVLASTTCLFHPFLVHQYRDQVFLKALGSDGIVRRVFHEVPPQIPSIWLSDHCRA